MLFRPKLERNGVSGHGQGEESGLILGLSDVVSAGLQSLLAQRAYLDASVNAALRDEADGAQDVKQDHDLLLESSIEGSSFP